MLAAARTGAGAGTAVTGIDRSPDRRRRWATVAAAALVVGGLAGGALVLGSRDGDRQPAVATDGPYCRALAARAIPPEGIDPDLSVYVTPASTGADIAAVGADLRDDPRVEAVRYVDAAATLERFRRLFAGQEAILASVGPEDLPTSYEVRLVPGVDLDEAIASFYEVPHVFDATAETIRHARVLDLLVASGRPVLQAGGPIAASSAPFARAWPGLVAAARKEAPAAPSAAISRLAAELERRQGLGPGAEPEEDPALEADADLLTRSAAEDCALEPAAWAATGAQDFDRVLSDAQLLPPGSTSTTDPAPSTSSTAPTTTTTTTAVTGGG